MVYCAVYGCKNNNYNCARKKKIKFFTFPKDAEYQKIWINACRRSDPINVKTARICSEHFGEDMLHKPLIQKLLQYSPEQSRKLKKEAVPTEKLPTQWQKMHVGVKTKSGGKQNRESPVVEPSSSTANINSDPNDSENVMETNDNVTEMENSVDTGVNRLKEQMLHNKIIISDMATKITNMDTEITVLKLETEKLEKIIQDQRKKIEEFTEREEKVKKHLQKIFTSGQIDLLMSDKKRIKKWSNEDIASAISLRSVSPKAYRYMREKLHHPLPGLSTLRNFASEFPVKPGLQENIILLMKNKGISMTPEERITALSFDEMYISPIIGYNKKEECIVGPHKRVQVIMARGLASPWKQPLFYDYDFDLTKEALFETISSLHDGGYHVVSVTSDMGGANTGLWKQLSVTHTQTCFSHPVTQEPIFVFADAPHLLKLARNHMLDEGFVLSDGTFIGKKVFEDVLAAQGHRDARFTYKISKVHLEVKGYQRQKVRLAAQLLSNNVASAIAFCGKHGFIQNRNWKEASTVTRLFNDWFDVLNTSVKLDKYAGRNAYGVNLENQNKILNDMDSFAKTTRIHQKKCLLPFQKGILLTNTSLRNLFQHLSQKYNLEYILTRRLNQDVLENFFSHMRSMGGTNTHPTALSFQHRFRWYVLGKHSDIIFSEGKNIEDKENENSLIRISDALIDDDREHNNENDDDITLTSDLISRSEVLSSQPNEEVATLEGTSGELCQLAASAEDLALLQQFELQVSAEKNSEDFVYKEAIRFISGYVAKRFSSECPDLSTEEIQEEQHTWIEFVSRGHLKYPSDFFFNIAEIMDKEFQSFHGSGLNHQKGIIKEIKDRTKQAIPPESVEDKVLDCLIRTRTFIRIRALNKEFQESSHSKKSQNHFKKFFH